MPSYKESPVQLHPQAPDTMLCLWVIVLVYNGLLAFLVVFPFSSISCDPPI